MRARDFFLFGLWAALLLALLAPSWLRPGEALSNFGDLYAYHYPLRHLTVAALQSGRLPFWNPYIFGGLPLAANPQSVLFYPVSLLGAFFPLGLALTWDCAFHLAWAGLGVWLLARRSRHSAAGAMLLATLFAFSPFLVYRVAEGIPTILAALAWSPWCWLALLSARPGLLAGAWSLQLLSGHPQFMAINALAMAVWLLFERRALSGLARMAKEGALVLALTALQWLPAWEFLSRSVRKAWPAAFTGAYSVPLAAYLTWIDPDVWGNAIAHTYAGPPSVFFETSGVHIGVMGLLLAGTGLWKGRRGAALALILGGAILAGGDNNPVSAAVLRFGPLHFLRTPARYLFLCLWGLLLAAGSGLRRLELALKARPGFRAAVVLAAMAELVLWDRAFLKSEDAAPYLRASPAVAEALGGRARRVMTDPELANPDKTMLYRAMNVNGYDAFYLDGYPQYAARSEGRPAADPSRTYLTRVDSPEMRRLGVAFFLSASGRLSPAASPYPLAYFVSPGGEFLGGAALSILRPEAWRVTGAAPHGAERLILAQPLYPGWKAWLNGRAVSLEVWDGLLQSVALPGAPGEGFVLDARFTPTLWPLWAALACLGWAAWLASWRKGLLKA